MYRAVTWAALEREIPLNDVDAVSALSESLDISISEQRVLVDGQDVTAEIRAPAVTQHIGPVADNPGVRNRLTHLQRRIAAHGDYVCEGRDQGTVVFPEAEVKFFLTASPTARARRRESDLARRGYRVPWEELLAQQMERDRRDESRPVGRLAPAADAIVVDTDELTLAQVVDLLLFHVRRQLEARPGT